MPICFLRKDRKGVDANGRESGKELGEGVGGKDTFRIYCMKKLFSIGKIINRNVEEKEFDKIPDSSKER